MDSFNVAPVQVVESLHRMNSPEMAPLLMFFKNLDEQTKVALIRADSDKFARLQGRAAFIEEFLVAVQNSAATLEKLHQPRS